MSRRGKQLLANKTIDKGNGPKQITKANGLFVDEGLQEGELLELK
jgi:hypothetical protein